MSNQIVGYIRVSSQGQCTDRQLSGIKIDKEFVDIMSGNTKERKALKECVDYVREGDTLIIDSIDRLARNLVDLQELVSSLIKKGVTVQFIKEHLTFTSKQDPMSMLMLQTMGAYAEFERSMIRSRQRDGIDAAKKAGKPNGRPSVITPQLIEKAKQLKEQSVSIRQISFKLNFSRATIYKMLEA